MFGAILPLLAPPAGAAEAGCGTPAALTDGWTVAAPAASGLDHAILNGICPRFQAWPEANLHAVLVARRGRLVFEQYFTGPDERHGRPTGITVFGPDTLHDLRSITKSVVSLVLGVAMGKGQVAGPDQPVLPLLPNYADLRSPDRDRITLRHLLTMSQGLSWNEDMPYSDPANSETRMDEAPDPVRFALSQPIAFPPGETFQYSGGSATIVAAVIRQATGQPIDAYARTVLFEPMGIAGYEWYRFDGGDAAPASGLRLKPRDTLKFGQLVLNRGEWQGKQIVPADWIVAATSPHIAARDGMSHGYQFWLGRSSVKGRTIEWIAGIGYGGQRLFIVPSLDLAVLVHAGAYRSRTQRVGPMAVLNEYVLPAVTDAQ